jgi:predicted transcriptional regulator
VKNDAIYIKVKPELKRKIKDLANKENKSVKDYITEKLEEFKDKKE